VFFAGEFAAFLTGANLVMEYVMSNAAVARSFTSYFATAIGVSTVKWRFTVPGLPKGLNQIDIVAVGVVLIITLIICYRCVHIPSLSLPFSHPHIKVVNFFFH
jgi:amino acid transporter